jgi:hypothetical protein
MAPRQPSFDANTTWRNFHQTYRQRIKGTFDLHFPRLGPQGTTTLADLVETTRQVQVLLARARLERVRVRAVGSRWSLSKAPTTDGWVLNTNRLRGWMRIGARSLHRDYPGTDDQRSGLFLFQCGNTVADVNEIIEDRRHQRALFTMGASNGQTIVGSTATGTHGSALDFASLHDHTVGLHLIVNETTHYWLERASRPVLVDGFASRIGATLRRDDDLFNATVLAFGSFGFIQAVAIETVPRYLLETETGIAALDEPMWQAIGALDFTEQPFFRGRGRPYFFQAVINPNNREVLLNANYRRPAPPEYLPRYGLQQGDDAIGPGFDTLSLIGRVLRVFPGIIPPFATIAAQQLFDLDPPDGTPGEVYGYKAPQLHTLSGSIVVDLPNARRALEAMIDLYRKMGPLPIVFACRYVRRSEALLAFNRFPISLVVNIDGIDNIDARAYCRAAADRMEAARIPFTQHWGKTDHYTPWRVRSAYGESLERWLRARRTLLPDAGDRWVFDNRYMRERGLVDEALVA